MELNSFPVPLWRTLDVPLVLVETDRIRMSVPGGSDDVVALLHKSHNSEHKFEYIK